jgi:hypothetical protein
MLQYLNTKTKKKVLSFRHDDNAEHYLYSLLFNTDKVEAVRDPLDKQGIKYRTFEPAEEGEPVGVHIVLRRHINIVA